MVSKKVTLVNKEGMHMRPAKELVGAMGKHSCDVTIHANGKTINAKSIMNLMAAAIKCGDEIEIVCDGADEEAALSEAVAMVEAGFGEA